MTHGSTDTAVPLLQVEGLSKTFPIGGGFMGKPTAHVHAVDNLSFDLHTGETLGLVGESGCGKSTAGKTILKLHEPTSGTVRLNGRDITSLITREMRPVRSEMQIIFQDPYSSLNPRMTAGAIVAEPMEIHGMARGKSKIDKVAQLFEQVGLRTDQMKRFPHEFSGGQRQRLAIARALSLEPKMIVADESVSALDVSIQASVINLMIDLQKERNLSFLFISHDMAVIEHISHRVAVMYLGRMVELAERKELFLNPLHPYTEALLSAVPIPDPKTDRKKRIFLKGDVPSPVNPPSGCHFHTRCPYAEKKCAVEQPALREISPGHHAACHIR